jgi:hypothetical protein
LQVPIEFFTDEKGQRVVDSGHRRTSALRLLATEKKPGFSHDMEVPALEVFGASLQELLLRSVSDNCHRLTLTQSERIRAAKTLAENGVLAEVAAKALDISVKQHARDLLVGEYPAVFDLVIKNAITPSNASRLLEAAVAEKRVAELQEDLAAWAAQTERKIAGEKTRKKLTVAQQLVKTYLTPALLNHWLAQLKKKERFTPVPAARADLGVGIDEAKHRVSIGVTEIDLLNVPLSQLAEFVSDVESAQRVMLSYLKSRRAVEVLGAQDVAHQESENPSGLEVLRQAGLADLADEIELRRMEDAEAAKEAAEEPTEDATEGGQ